MTSDNVVELLDYFWVEWFFLFNFSPYAMEMDIIPPGN